MPEPCSLCIIYPSPSSWGPDIAPARSHCRECHRSWASRVEGHCTVCHRHFAGYPAFDAHFVGDEHVDPATITRKDGRPRFTQRHSPFGLTWRLAFYGKRPDFDGDDLDDLDVELELLSDPVEPAPTLA